MDMEIKNGGAGPDIGAHVDINEQLHTHTVMETEIQDATRKGNAYNINTGWISLTSASESGVLYFKNDEAPVNGQSGFVIDAIAVAVDSAGTTTAGLPTDVTVVRNPTSVSFSTDVDMNQNRNFGSSNTLSSTTLAYKGAEGATITGGDDIALFAQNHGARGYYTVDLEVPKGSSVAVKMNTQTTAGTTKVYAAIIGHRIDGSNT